MDVSTYPAKPDFKGYDAVVDKFNGGHTVKLTHSPRELELALTAFVRNGGGLVVFPTLSPRKFSGFSRGQVGRLWTGGLIE